MAQHYPIDNFKQKAMKQIAASIRKDRYFKTSMKYEALPAEYNETDNDQVFVTNRRVPISLTGFTQGTFEVHTQPHPESRHFRQVTNIYFVA